MIATIGPIINTIDLIIKANISKIAAINLSFRLDSLRASALYLNNLITK